MSRSKRWATLILLMIVVAAVCAVTALRWDQSMQSELAAVERLTARGFSFTYHETGLAKLRNVLGTLGLNPRTGQRVRTAHFAGDLSSLVDISELSLLTDLRSITLIESDEEKDNRAVVTDELLAPLNCNSLEEVVVTARSGITDGFLARFNGSPVIQVILLDQSRITDRGLQHLGRCQNLGGISVEGCQISNIGIEAVIDLPSLNRLFLDRTQVNADVLTIFTRSQTLKTAYLCGTGVTLADAVRFTRDHPVLIRVGDPANPHEVQLGESTLPYAADTDAAGNGDSI